jgi:hypothetical protein
MLFDPTASRGSDCGEASLKFPHLKMRLRMYYHESGSLPYSQVQITGPHEKLMHTSMQL